MVSGFDNGSFFERSLKFLSLFEFVQATRMILQNESMVEFNPMLKVGDSATTDVRYRRLFILFTMILGVSRLITVQTKSASVLRLTFSIHVMEFFYFLSEYQAVKQPTLKMRALLAIVAAIPAAMYLNKNTFPDKE